MAQLNPRQYEAVWHRGGPLLVLAGAGSGKTRVITERIAALVERDVPPEAITAVTFTNKAAREMRERLAGRLGDRASDLRICTFHALGLMMVREDAELVQRRSNVSVFAGGEQRAALRSVLQEMRLPVDAKQVDAMLARISALKNGLTPGDEALAAIRERYDALLAAMNAVDFDDLLLLPIRMLSESDEVRAKWRERCRHLLVDEYQDSSRVQYELLRLLAPPDANLTVVGDDDQSIYGWRGAEIGNIFRMDQDWPGLKVIRLEENYRSTAAILHVANTLISHNSERLGKELRSSLGAGRPVRIWECATPEDEAERVAADIVARHAGGRSRWSDFCVLYRASHQSRQLEKALRERGAPYQVSGGLSFFDRAEVRDVLSWMRLIANPEDDLAFLRAITRPRRGLGDKALAALGAVARAAGKPLLDACFEDALEHPRALAFREFGHLVGELEHRFRHGEPDDAFDALLEESGLVAMIAADAADEAEREMRMANVMELRRWWLAHAEGPVGGGVGSGIDGGLGGRGGDLAGFIQRLSLFADRDNEEDGNAVRLMTVHAAKGLEFEHVYVVGMEDGSFPHQGAVDEGRMEEERRLMYVAITRARYRLTLSRSRKRRRYGKEERLAPSPFLAELGDEHVEWVDRQPDSESSREEIAAHMEAMRRALGLA